MELVGRVVLHELVADGVGKDVVRWQRSASLWLVILGVTVGLTVLHRWLTSGLWCIWGVGVKGFSITNCQADQLLLRYL